MEETNLRRVEVEASRFKTRPNIVLVRFSFAKVERIQSIQ